jgi:hypothetical protein
MHLAAATNMQRFFVPHWRSRELKAASCPKNRSCGMAADLGWIESFADHMFRYRLSHGTERGGYCLRLPPSNWIKLMSCTFTQWLTGLTFLIGSRCCQAEWVS